MYSAEHAYGQSLFVVPRRVQEPARNDKFRRFQSFNSKDLTEVTSPDFYDYIVIDEFHHAAAPSYQELLEYYQPKV